MRTQTIWLHDGVPAKPELGQTCNGCGVCCASEPCPVGMLVSARRRGRCRVLRYDATLGRYRCGLMMASRWIAAGTGCDSHALAEPRHTTTPVSTQH
jgi:hypothetical protein